jgi:hypothetical protein
MSTETEGAAAPADVSAVSNAPTGSEQATPNASVQSDAAPENAETKAQPEGEADIGSDGDDADGKPKQLSRAQRLQRKAARLATMVAEQGAELERLRAASSASSTASSEPKEADYNGDFTAYLADRAAWKAAQTISEKLDARDKQSATEKAITARQEALSDFVERAEDAKAKIPDFDATFETFARAGGQFAPHVVEELHESEHGPVLAYQLAKNPRLAAELNAMSPRDAAREIGRLEAKVSLPQPKKQTQAPPPLKALTGGASPPTDMAKLAQSEDITEFVKAVRARKASA